MSRLLIFLLLSAFFSHSCQKKEKEKPITLFIFADDQTYLGVNAPGNNEVISPNIYKLAQSGVTFTHTYNMGGWNGAICVASRAMLNTGKFLWDAKAEEDKDYEQMQVNESFWRQMMQNAGYDTYMTGKWHVKQPADSIFQMAADIRPGMPNTVQEAYNRPLSPEDTTWLPWHTKYGGFWEGGKHWCEVVADNAIQFLNSAKNSSNQIKIINLI